MRYLADTNVWIHYLKSRNSLVEAKLRSIHANEIVICSLIKAELYHGALKYGNAERRQAIVEETLAPYVSLPFDDLAARHYAEIRHALELSGSRIGSHDLLIASIARSRGLVVATGNVDEFSRVPGLVVEDWTVQV